MPGLARVFACIGARVRISASRTVRIGVPRPDLVVSPALVPRHEPLSAGPLATPHIAEEAIRLGGESVYLIGQWVPRDPYREWARQHRMNPLGH
jgi:hypothetical protein